MKKILLLILILPLVGQAQDWKTVSLSDTTYFTVTQHQDTNYLRAIWVDSTNTATNGDSIFYFYPSVRADSTANNCIDTLGDTWLGKKMFRSSDGVEYYFNRYHDTIKLQTHALTNGNWTMHMDSVGNQYRAHVIQLDTMTIDGQLDSIKTILVNVLYNNTPQNNHPYNNKFIILSKNHGFVQMFETYGFGLINNVGSLHHPETNYPIFNELHHRLGNHVNNANTQVDIPTLYQVGNIWQTVTIEDVTWGAIYKKTTYESNEVLSVQPLSGSQLVAEMEVCIHTISASFGGGGNPPVWSYTTTKNTFLRNDTVSVQPNNIPFQSVILPEYSYGTTTSQQKNLYYYTPDSVFNNAYFLRTVFLPACINFSSPACPIISPGLCAYGHTQDTHFSVFGASNEYSVLYNANVGFSSYQKDSKELGYLKIGNKTIGNYTDCLVLNNSNIDKLTSDIIVYPQPADDILKFKNLSPKASIKIYSIDGILQHESQNSNVGVSRFANGIYLVRIKDDEQFFIKKIIIQH